MILTRKYPHKTVMFKMSCFHIHTGRYLLFIQLYKIKSGNETLSHLDIIAEHDTTMAVLYCCRNHFPQSRCFYFQVTTFPVEM